MPEGARPKLIAPKERPRIPEPDDPPHIPEAPKRPRRWLRWVILVCVLTGLILGLKNEKHRNAVLDKVEKTFARLVEEFGNFKERVVEGFDADRGKEPSRLPANGTEFINYQGGAVSPPLKIYNRSSDLHTIIKLEDFESGELVAKYFVRAGQHIEKHLPVGRFRMKFASGKEWYGEPDLFGRHTQSAMMTGAITVNPHGDRIWLHPSEIELNIQLPIGSPQRRQSKTFSPGAW